MRSRHPHDRLRDDMLRSGERTLLAALRVLDEVHRQVPHPCHGGCTAPGADHLAPHLDAESRLADGVFRHLWFMGSRRRCLANSNQRYVVYSLFYNLLFLYLKATLLRVPYPKGANETLFITPPLSVRLSE